VGIPNKIQIRTDANIPLYFVMVMVVWYSIRIYERNKNNEIRRRGRGQPFRPFIDHCTTYVLWVSYSRKPVILLSRLSSTADCGRHIGSLPFIATEQRISSSATSISLGERDYLWRFTLQFACPLLILLLLLPLIFWLYVRL